MAQGKYSKARKGIFTPKNPQKYSGNVANIVYRSGLELKLFNYLDSRHDVISWVSEEDPVIYFNPVKQRAARYFYDVKCVFRGKNGKQSTVLIEVKSKSETKAPVKKKINRRYVESVITWTINVAKWKAATAYCQERGWYFRIMTEDQLNFKAMNSA